MIIGFSYELRDDAVIGRLLWNFVSRCFYSYTYDFHINKTLFIENGLSFDFLYFGFQGKRGRGSSRHGD